MEFSEQILTVHQVASRFWGRELHELSTPMKAIRVIKRTGGKMVGFLPPFDEHPEAYFKVYFNNALEYELRGLQAVQKMTQVPGVITPDVLHIYPEHKAILFAKRDWDDTTSPIKRFFVGSLGIDWRTLGRWLRAFHDSQVSDLPNEKFLRRKFKKTEAHLAALQTLFTPRQIDAMQGIIADARAYFAAEPVEWVISHGDFGLDNIKKKGNILEIIDFEDCQMAPRAFDLLNCLARLEYSSYFPDLPGTGHRIHSDFFNGYNNLLDVGKSDYRFFYLYTKLDSLRTYYCRSQNEGIKISDKLIFQYFEKLGLRQLKTWLALL